MLVTPSGITQFFNPVSAKALLPIAVIVLGMVEFSVPHTKVLVAVSTIALQFSLLSYFLFPSSTTMDFRLGQPLNIRLPILDTLAEILIDSRLVQFQKT